MLLYDDTVILDIIKHYLAHSYLRPDCPLSYVVNLVMDRYVRNPSLPKIMWEIMKLEDLENADLWKEWVADQESKATNFIEWGLRVYEAEQNNIDRPSMLDSMHGDIQCPPREMDHHRIAITTERDNFFDNCTTTTPIVMELLNIQEDISCVITII